MTFRVEQFEVKLHKNVLGVRLDVAGRTGSKNVCVYVPAG